MERWVDLAMVAHELGGALAPTRNAVQLLRGGSAALAPEQERLLAIAGRGLERAERVLQNICSIALLEEAELRPEPTDVHDVLRRLIDEHRAEARARGIRLTFEVEPDVAAMPLAAFAFEQVLVNLLTNALKFTPPGGAVHVAARPAPGAVLPGRMLLLAGGFGIKPIFVKLRVADTGVGLADETRRRLFQPFCRGPEATGVPGMGLGLAVSSRLARRMGGDLRAESPPRGASFVLTLPADGRTQLLIERVDGLVAELERRLAAGPCSVALVRHALGHVGPPEGIQEALRRWLGDPACRAAGLSETTLVVWSAAALRPFVRGLAAVLRQLHDQPVAEALRLAVRRAAPTLPADLLLLQAGVRCRHGVAALERQREVLHGQDSGR